MAGGLAKEPWKAQNAVATGQKLLSPEPRGKLAAITSCASGREQTQAFCRVEMSSKGSECKGWGWKAARREGGLWLAWPREPAEARALRKLSRSVARATKGPQPPHLHPFHASPWRFRQGFFGFCAAALGASAEGFHQCFSGRSPPVVVAVGMPIRCSAGAVLLQVQMLYIVLAEQQTASTDSIEQRIN
jgi:hypothetical protein